VERLGYAVGLEALKAVQHQETILWKVAETLDAPLEKLDKTAEKLVAELKVANMEKRRLIKELASKESQANVAAAAGMVQGIKGINLTKRDFQESIDTARMVQTASETVKRDEAAVALFYGSDGKTARILVMAGKTAVESGVNAGDVVKQVSPLIGGGGGGRRDFAQGGGTKQENLQEAVKVAEEAIRKQLKG